MNISLDEKIDQLNLSTEYILLLEKNQIFLIKDLWLKSRKDLKELHFTDEQIKYLSIKLQLWGLDLGGKMY